LLRKNTPGIITIKKQSSKCSFQGDPGILSLIQANHLVEAQQSCRFVITDKFYYCAESNHPHDSLQGHDVSNECPRLYHSIHIHRKTQLDHLKINFQFLMINQYYVKSAEFDLILIQ